MRKLYLFLVFLILTGCVSVILKPVDFAWPLEGVIDVDENGFIQDTRYSFTINVKSLFFAEKNDSTAYNSASVRIIRGKEGFYYMTSQGFKNIYVFNVTNGTMQLENKIFISEYGLDLPAFNQRTPYIELLEGDSHLLFFDYSGIKGEE